MTKPIHILFVFLCFSLSIYAQADTNYSRTGTQVISPSQGLSHVVKEVFYGTWWFIGILVMIAFAIAYVFYYYRIREYEKTLALRTRIASNLHDEVGGLLTRIALQAELINELDSEEKKASLIRKIAATSRQAVSTMGDIIWSIDSRNDKFSIMTDRMHEYVQEALAVSDISYTFEIKNIDAQQLIPLNTRQNIYLIFKEAINNIVKHSNATKTDIFIGNENGKFRLKILDNGTKSPSKTKFNGQGISNMQMRAKTIKAVLIIDKENGYMILLEMQSMKK